MMFDKTIQTVHKGQKQQTEVFALKHTEIFTMKVLYCMTMYNGLQVNSSPYFTSAKFWHNRPLLKACLEAEQKDSTIFSEFSFNKKKK